MKIERERKREEERGREVKVIIRKSRIGVKQPLLLTHLVSLFRLPFNFCYPFIFGILFFEEPSMGSQFSRLK